VDNTVVVLSSWEEPPLSPDLLAGGADVQLKALLLFLPVLPSSQL
jgi:hypothetical protein